MTHHARITRRHFLTSTAAAGAALAAPAATWAQAPAAQRPVEQITVLQLDEVASLDPLADFTNPGLQMHAHILEPLIDFTGPDFKMTPKLALSWDNPTPTRWRFKLRPNVTWHDGTPFTAEDVKYTFEKAKGPTSVKNRYLARVQKIDVLDPLTIQMELDAAYAPLLGSWVYLYIVQKKAYEAGGTAEFGKKPVGTGPYRMVEWQKQQQLVLEAYDKHWNGPHTPEAHRRARHPRGGHAARRAADGARRHHLRRAHRAGQERGGQPPAQAHRPAGRAPAVLRVQHEEAAVRRPARAPGHELRRRSRGHRQRHPAGLRRGPHRPLQPDPGELQPRGPAVQARPRPGARAPQGGGQGRGLRLHLAPAQGLHGQGRGDHAGPRQSARQGQHQGEPPVRRVERVHAALRERGVRDGRQRAGASRSRPTASSRACAGSPRTASSTATRRSTRPSTRPAPPSACPSAPASTRTPTASCARTAWACSPTPSPSCTAPIAGIPWQPWAYAGNAGLLTYYVPKG